MRRSFLLADPNYAKPTSINLTLALRSRVEAQAARMGVTRTDFIRIAVEKVVAELEEKQRANQDE